MQKDYFIRKLRNLKPKMPAGTIRFWGEFYRRHHYVPVFQDYATNVAIEAYCESFLLKRKSEKRKKALTLFS